MKRLLLILITLASLVTPAQAQEPRDHHVYLPAVIAGGCDMASTSLATLEISDGSVTVNLLRGNIHLADWNPAIPQLKSGGIWQDSALATGRRMVDRRFGNVNDSLSLVVSSPNQDDTIREIGDLLHLLEKARDFTASSWQSDPVWIKRQAGCETNPTYALIYDYKIPQLSNPYAAPFAAATQLATMNNFTLSTEHSIWLSCRPGAGECVQASGVQAWNTSTWTVVSVGPTDVYEFVQTTTGRIIAAGDVGQVWRSDDNGATWAAIAGPAGVAFLAIVQTPTGRIIAGGNDSSIYKSDDDGATWQLLTAAPVNAVQSLLVLTSGRILAGEAAAIWKSDDDGATWAATGAGPVQYVYAILQTATGRVLSSDLGQIWKSDDEGNTWSLATTIPANYVYSLAQTSSGRILAGENGQIWGSDDSGDSWSLMVTGWGAVNNFVETIMQTSNGDIFAGEYALVHRSQDDGITWTTENASFTAARLIEDLYQISTGAVLAGVQNDHKLWEYTNTGNISMGAAATCDDGIFVSNKYNVANLTHIYISDGGVFSANLFPQTLPGHTHLLPAAPAVNDAVYFGIDSTVTNSGPFESLVFDLYDIISYDNSYTIVWEYVSVVGPGPGFALTWTALPVQDGTNPGTGAFRTLGVSSVHWSPPANWVDTGGGSVNGVTGWWVRARVSALAGTMTSPSQQNRNIYTAVLPYADIAAAQVGGDIPALAQVKLHNRSDKDGRGGSGPDLWDNRVIVGGRSYDRGPTFTAYLNASDEQNPAGVTVTLGANTTVPAGISGITGKLCTWAAALADTTFTDRVTFTLGPTIARDFYGTFHAFLRASVTAGSSGDIHARLQVRTGSGGVTLTSVDDYLKGTTDYEVLDFGRVSIPASGLLSFDDLGDSTVLAVQFRNDSGAARTVYVHDLILIPVDECAVDATDYANITLSVIGLTSSTPHLLDFDSLTYHKIDVRTLVRTADGNGFVTSVYVPGGGPMVLQANARQRLWTFAMQTSATGTAYVWLAPPWIAHSVQVWINSRWLGLRGDR